MTDRYGNRRVPKMREQWNAHRDACRAEGTPAVQETLDAVEEWIDFAFGQNGRADNERGE